MANTTDLLQHFVDQWSTALIDSFHKSVFGTIDPPPPDVRIDMDNDDLDERLTDLAQRVQRMHEENERVRVALTSNAAHAVGGLISASQIYGTTSNQIYGTTSTMPGAKDAEAPRTTVSMSISKVVNGYTVTIGSRVWVCSGDKELSDIIIVALADLKLGG